VYDVALSVLSCLHAGTDVHVAWVVAPPPSFPGEAVALTPGGGRVGNLMGGALDGAITEAAHGLDADGRLVEVELGPVEAILTGRPEGTVITLAVIAGDLLPRSVWEGLAERQPVRFALRVTGAHLDQPDPLEAAPPAVELSADRLVTSLVPVPRAVISGAGPIAARLVDAFALVGWEAEVFADVGPAAGLMATLAGIDAVVVMGHDVESSGRALQAAIESGAGYIASIGSPRMQQLRREWLAYRGVDWDDRVHGPAGIPIGASNPAEIAISIVAEAISAHEAPPELR
jgi:xanthine dehydrogenase accessory factor